MLIDRPAAMARVMLCLRTCAWIYLCHGVHVSRRIMLLYYTF